MGAVEVVGVTRTHLVLRVGDETVEVPLEDVRRAERQADRQLTVLPDLTEPLTPKLIQQRIRCGESAQQVAQTGSWPLELVARYEGPVLAERAHHASAARRSEVDGRPVEELIADHLGQPAEAVEWDSWLVEHRLWEVSASAGGQSVRLRWNPRARQVQALDEPARRALRVPAPGEDVLTAVLRPVSAGPMIGPSPLLPRKGRRNRSEVPLWGEISDQVTGRGPEPES